MAKIQVPHFTCGSPVIGYYLAAVDANAERARRVSPAQEVVYQRKLAEAKAGGGELLAAEALALGVAVSVVCERVLQARADWERNAHAVEVARIKAKAAIRAAKTPADMHAAVEAAFGD